MYTRSVVEQQEKRLLDVILLSKVRGGLSFVDAKLHMKREGLYATAHLIFRESRGRDEEVWTLADNQCKKFGLKRGLELMDNPKYLDWVISLYQKGVEPTKRKEMYVSFLYIGVYFFLCLQGVIGVIQNTKLLQFPITIALVFCVLNYVVWKMYMWHSESILEDAMYAAPKVENDTVWEYFQRYLMLYKYELKFFETMKFQTVNGTTQEEKEWEILEVKKYIQQKEGYLTYLDEVSTHTFEHILNRLAHQEQIEGGVVTNIRTPRRKARIVGSREVIPQRESNMDREWIIPRQENEKEQLSEEENCKIQDMWCKVGSHYKDLETTKQYYFEETGGITTEKKKTVLKAIEKQERELNILQDRKALGQITKGYEKYDMKVVWHPNYVNWVLQSYTKEGETKEESIPLTVYLPLIFADVGILGLLSYGVGLDIRKFLLYSVLLLLVSVVCCNRYKYFQFKKQISQAPKVETAQKWKIFKQILFSYAYGMELYTYSDLQTEVGVWTDIAKQGLERVKENLAKRMRIIENAEYVKEQHMLFFDFVERLYDELKKEVDRKGVHKVVPPGDEVGIVLELQDSLERLDMKPIVLERLQKELDKRNWEDVEIQTKVGKEMEELMTEFVFGREESNYIFPLIFEVLPTAREVEILEILTSLVQRSKYKSAVQREIVELQHSANLNTLREYLKKRY